MDLQRLREDWIAAWNTTGRLIELLAILLLTILLTILDGVSWFLNEGRDWVEDGHKLPTWLRIGNRKTPYCHECGMPYEGTVCPQAVTHGQ